MSYLQQSKKQTTPTVQQAQVATLEQRQQKASALYSPSKCYKGLNKLRTVKDAIMLPSKSLTEFARDFGREWVLAYVTLWLIDLNDYSICKRKMSDAQIEHTAQRIYDEYRLKITDMTLFFARCKDEYYEASFESLTGAKVLRWLQMYFDERCEAAQMVSEKDHDKISLTKDPIDPKVIAKMFEGVGEEKVVHDHKGNGLGTRMWNEIKRTSPIVSKAFEEQKKKAAKPKKIKKKPKS